MSCIVCSPCPEGPEEASDAGKVEAVLRVLGDEDRIGVARDLGVGLETLEEWERVFLQAGRDGLARARAPMADAERMRTRAKIGELTMRVDLLERFLARKGYADEVASMRGRARRARTQKADDAVP